MSLFFIVFLAGAALGITVFAWFTRHECDAAFKQGRDFAEKVTAKTYANVYRMGYEAGAKEPGKYEDVGY